MPLSMVTVLAFDVVQLKVADSPALIVWGYTEKLTAGGLRTVTVTDAVVVPQGHVAVNV